MQTIFHFVISLSIPCIIMVSVQSIFDKYSERVNFCVNLNFFLHADKSQPLFITLTFAKQWNKSPFLNIQFEEKGSQKLFLLFGMALAEVAESIHN